MVRARARARVLASIGAVLLACTGKSDAGGPAPESEAVAERPALAPARPPVPAEPVVFACTQPVGAAGAEAAGYHFAGDGPGFEPHITVLSGDPQPGPGDILRVWGHTIVLGPPGRYQFSGGYRGQLLELAIDDGPRHVVALMLGRSVELPEVDLSHLRGLSVGTWTHELTAALAAVDHTQLFVDLHVSDLAPVYGLPAALRYLRLSITSAILGGDRANSRALPLPLLAELPRLRHLEIEVNARPPDQIDAGELAGLAGLERLELDLPLRHGERLGALARLQALVVANGTDDVGFVAALPGLRWLDLRRTAVTSLAPLAGHPGLEVVLADAAPIATLPAEPPPRLRTLSLLGTEVAAAEVEAFASRARDVYIRRRWNQALADVAACAAGVRLRTGGLCHRRPEEERTLFVSEHPAEVRALLPLLRIDDSQKDHSCMCCGSFTLELVRDDRIIAEVGVHHGKSLRWHGWPNDGVLVEPGPLCAWLQQRGAPEACAPQW